MTLEKYLVPHFLMLVVFTVIFCMVGAKDMAITFAVVYGLLTIFGLFIFKFDENKKE